MKKTAFVALFTLLAVVFVAGSTANGNSSANEGGNSAAMAFAEKTDGEVVGTFFNAEKDEMAIHPGCVNGSPARAEEAGDCCEIIAPLICEDLCPCGYAGYVCSPNPSGRGCKGVCFCNVCPV